MQLTRVAVVILLASILGLAAGCESGWDLKGQVRTSDAPDKERPIYVYEVDAPMIDPEALKNGDPSLQYLLMESADRMPADTLPFGHGRLGCHRGQVAVVAWSPAPWAVPGSTGSASFKPESGDYVVASDVRIPYCGWGSNPENFQLVLDARALR